MYELIFRAVRGTMFTRSEQQLNMSECQDEEKNIECLPSGVINVSTDLVYCKAGKWEIINK